jgi:hypothetical protein
VHTHKDEGAPPRTRKIVRTNEKKKKKKKKKSKGLPMRSQRQHAIKQMATCDNKSVVRTCEFVGAAADILDCSVALLCLCAQKKQRKPRTRKKRTAPNAEQ